MEPLVFDPAFTTPEDAPIFQSSDGVCFRFPWKPLVAVSSFFRDLQTVRLPPAQDQDLPPVIPLLSALSKGLRTAFLVLKSIGDTSVRVPTSDLSDLSHLVDVVTVADAYDLNIVLETLQTIYTANRNWKTSFTLFAVLHDVNGMENVMTYILASSSYPLEDWMKDVLSTKAPQASYKFTKIANFHAVNIERFDERARFLAKNSYRGFLQTCRQKGCQQGCSEFKAWPSFEALAYRKISRAVVLMHRGHGHDVIEPAVTASLKCLHCASRLLDLLREARVYSRYDWTYIKNCYRSIPWV
ncbi:uncharacterized protein EHS24_000437 [Apiotrichum porosum]|uniref:Uncharacterized protein n=1 Tax=Apiotrichum porosum TaxID=105984 RepID=A0A427YA00_9TREE|nr:uncharacterized protein EHS24_000437 [Apiotrichum porosum]RSH87918.1 hypothetical protein EHS24_000437 [Apiotrichum porosum]